jgi:ParB family transcriptional regulator, chromosome partitioning protein
MSKKRLGKGLSALLPSPSQEEEERSSLRELLLESISLNPRQPRQHIDEDALAELAASIQEHGILQPVIVQQKEDGEFTLVAGERRYRAARLAGLHTIPAVVKDLSPAEVMEIALIENLQREDLNPVEEAMAYKQLLEEFGFTQEQLAQRIGKSRPTVANMLRLLQLPADVLQSLGEGRLSMGHARALLALQQEEKILQAADYVTDNGLSVRATEEMVNKLLSPKKKTQRTGRKEALPKAEDIFTNDLAERLQHHLGCQVRIKKQGEGGRVEVVFYNEEELERIVEIILDEEKLY